MPMPMRWFKGEEKKSDRGDRRGGLDVPLLERELGVRIGERGRKVLELATTEVERSNHRELGAEHMIVGMLEEGGPAAQLMIEHGMTLEEARSGVAEALWEEGEQSEKLELTPEASNILATAAEAAGMRGHPAIEPEHIAYGVACSGFEITSRVLHMVGVDRQKLLQDAERLLTQGP
jgi:ATP-dependent Clp protease ATP-binding subunit ClpC